MIVVSATGQVLKTKTLRRLPPSHRWDRDWLLRVTGTEIQPNPGESDARIPVRLDPRVMHDIEMPRPEPAPPRTRGVKLFEGDFWAAGFTDHCRGCELIGQGSALHKVHTPACRRRMEEHLATSADGRRRLQAAAERQAIEAPADEETGSPETPRLHPEPSLQTPAPPAAALEADADMDIDLIEINNISILAFVPSSPELNCVGEVYSPLRVVPYC